MLGDHPVYVIARDVAIMLMFLIASYQDIKSRSVDDKVWLVFSPIIAGSVAAQIYFEGLSNAHIWLVSATLALLFAAVTVLMRLGGAADAIAIAFTAAVKPVNMLLLPPVVTYLTANIMGLMYGIAYTVYWNTRHGIECIEFSGLKRVVYAMVIACVSEEELKSGRFMPFCGKLSVTTECKPREVGGKYPATYAIPMIPFIAFGYLTYVILALLASA